jgi:hypothetical protein
VVLSGTTGDGGSGGGRGGGVIGERAGVEVVCEPGSCVNNIGAVADAY